MIGVISLKFIDFLNRNAEIAMVLSFNKKHGAALQAMTLITEHGFDRLNLLKIYAGTNAALWKFANTLETIGYRMEVLRKNMGIRNGIAFYFLFIAIDKDDYYKLKEERKGHLIDSMEKLYASKKRKNPVPDLKDFFASL